MDFEQNLVQYLLSSCATNWLFKYISRRYCYLLFVAVAVVVVLISKAIPDGAYFKLLKWHKFRMLFTQIYRQTTAYWDQD